MRIGIPLFGCDGGRSGIGRYLQQTLNELQRQAPRHRLLLIGSSADAATFGRDVSADVTLVGRPLCGRAPNLLWHQTALPVIAARARLDLLFMPAANRRLPLWSPCPTVGTVHDLSALRLPGKYDRTHDMYIRHVLPRLVRRLSRVVTVSESSRRDIAALAGIPSERITVVPNGVDTERMRPTPRAVALRKLAHRIPVDRPYLLYVSRVEHPGKNHVRLIEAFAQMKAAPAVPHRLVLAGPLRERAEIVQAAAEESGVGADIIFTDFMPDEELPALYAAADALIFPSLYEGFGIPLLEAMACATPVAAARTSSLPEVAGEAAVYFDPRDPADMAAAVRRLLHTPGLRRRMVGAGLARVRHFSWRESARRLLQVFEDAAATREIRTPTA